MYWKTVLINYFQCDLRSTCNLIPVGSRYKSPDTLHFAISTTHYANTVQSKLSSQHTVPIRTAHHAVGLIVPMLHRDPAAHCGNLPLLHPAMFQEAAHKEGQGHWHEVRSAAGAGLQRQGDLFRRFTRLMLGTGDLIRRFTRLMLGTGDLIRRFTRLMLGTGDLIRLLSRISWFTALDISNK